LAFYVNRIQLERFLLLATKSNLTASPLGKTLLHGKALHLGKTALLSHKHTHEEQILEFQENSRAVIHVHLEI